MKKIIKESGLRNIKALADRYPKAKIYFHQDLDGVTTALAMKNYLENNGIEVVDSEIIQYGDKEFAVKKQDATGDVMPVLVDFAHGKPMFVIHTDHHDSQSGVEGDTSVSFRPSRSNVATVSQILSPKEIFPSSDILMVSTIDSADYAKYNITPDQVMNLIFRLDKDQSLQNNKTLLSLVTNKLLLAYKNKPNFLERLVMNSSPSLLNIFQNIKKIAKEEGYATPEQMLANQQKYVESQASSPDVKYEDGIIVQWGGGALYKPGSYDRYTPFKNYPDADFFVIAWPMGLVQASCNPFKVDRELKGVDLGKIKDEVLSKWESSLKQRIIPLSTIKWVSETSAGEGSVGFTSADLEAFYGKKIRSTKDGDRKMQKLKNIMDKPSRELQESDWELLDKLGVSAWDIIDANSGGHKCITNISALNYFGRKTRPPRGGRRFGGGKSDYVPAHVKFAKMIQDEFVKVLKEKIAESNALNESAEDLRSVLDNLGIREKQIYSVGELTSAGEITDNLSDIAEKLFKDIKSEVPNANIRVTAGNDLYHSRKGGLHPEGKAIDFTVSDYPAHYRKINSILKKYEQNYPGFNYLDEYRSGSKYKTGGHFHFSYDEGDEVPVEKNIEKVREITIDDIIKNNDNRAVIGFGSSGEGVEEIQQILKDLEYDLGDGGIDGKYGSDTKKAVMKFQKDNDLQVDGVVGIETSSKLKELI